MVGRKAASAMASASARSFFPAAANLRAVVAVMPLLPRRTPAELWSLGEVAAEEAIRGLSHAPGFAVISRLSTGALAGRGLSVSDLGAALGADYVVTGTFDVSGDNLRLNVELAEVGSSRVIWSESLTGRVDALFESDGMLIGELVSRIAGGIARCELDHARRAPMSTLKAYTLLLGAVTLLHRLSRRDFDFARSLLEALAERSPRQPLPLAWLANWHVMRVNQGWSDDPERDARLARSACQRARDADPGCPLALTMEGAVNVNFLRRFDLAEASFDTALSIDPSTSLAWLLRAALRAFTDRGAEAVTDAHQALRLSPCDPHRFLYLSIAASAHLTAGEEAAALSLAEQSLKANRVHASTLRVKATAEWHLGLEAKARATTAELLRLVPGFTLDGYLSRSPATGSAVGGRVVEALRACGVPP
jgi:adenylate cyclase